LWYANEKDSSLQKYTANDDSLYKRKIWGTIRQIFVSPKGDLYLATYLGVKILDPRTGKFSEITTEPKDGLSITSNAISSLTIDSAGYLWVSCVVPDSRLNRIDLVHRTRKIYDHFIDPGKKWKTNSLQKILTDNKGRVWAISTYSGISMYDPSKDDFVDTKSDPYISNSPLTNHNVSIYQDKEGIIWLGTAGFGLSYFNPDKNLFSSIYPLAAENTLATDTWCRAACEDDENNLWLATGKGIVKYNKDKQSFSVISNKDDGKRELYYNSVRSLLKDNYGDIWIGTAKGLNRYHPSTGKMDFFDEKQGIPLAFFWMMTQQKNGQLWMGSASGLYKYIREDNRFDDLTKDPVLSKYAHQNIQAIYTDSKDRIWAGIWGIGIIMYDSKTSELRLLTIKDSLVSDDRTSNFAEDKYGNIWIGSEQGLTCYDPVKNRSVIYTRANGLSSDRTNNLTFDNKGRLWIGTSNGLCLMSADRKIIKHFDTNDGLMSNQFNEQTSFKTREGLFVFPTYKGFVVFNPDNYKERTDPLPLYITAFHVEGKRNSGYSSTENLDKIRLRYNENFFNLELAGLNFMNPYECTYAYKLEPFNGDWIYTNKREISYTNVPPGTYSFRYKVFTGDNAQAVPERSMKLVITQVFYKTGWFKLFVLIVIISGIIAFFRYRMLHRESILRLQNKAQQLEKEKTLVMYESLKQHLNPHFLFNSLTSLRSLIRTDTANATHFLDGMSKVYRYVLKSGEHELMPVKDELDFVKTFVELQKTRFGDGLDVCINVDDAALNKLIIPVTLQNLVENAIKHNTADRESPLLIKIFDEGNYLIVENNLQRYKVVESSNKRGLSSLRTLYGFFSATPLEIIEDEEIFRVKIPLL